MKQFILTLLTALFFTGLMAQSSGNTDTAKMLQTVVVKAYEQNRQLKEVGAAINFIGQAQLERFNNTNILPALNNTPGVHMEERSPGSYRLNVRGSTVRSAFGVRNVKIYWNGIPFTDPGGGTYLNQLSYYNISSIEVIKGPASSLYGAGTGGAVLINSQSEEWQPGVDLSYLRGSYNLNNLNTQVRFGGEEHRNSLGFSHQTSDGYRDHTQMRRDVATWVTQIKASDRQQLTASVLYGDLYYQTPGGLTKAGYISNPRAARGAAGMFPSADVAKAAIYQQTFLAGITHQYNFSERFQNSSVAYGAFSQIKNPTFRNYEKRMEPHFGGRTVFTWQPNAGTTGIKVLFGAEAQQGFFNVKLFGNNKGNMDTLQSDDDVKNSIYSLFVQSDFSFPGNWTISAGVSSTQSSITINRLSVPGFVPVKRKYSNELSPRISLSNKITSNLLAYASVSKGFSPPTSSEVLPSTSVISLGLQAERGLNYEAGIKSNWLQQRLYIEVNGFYYQLKNAIALRRDSSGADYYVNAGATRQWGIESQAYYQLLPNTNKFISSARVGISYTYSHFRYHNFKQDTINYSMKKIPSVAPHALAATVDVLTSIGVYTNITWYYSDAIPLNDANTDFASSYNLTGIRAGWKKSISKKIQLDLFAGVDNLFDVRYSLGNDINATGNRFYNAAPGVNYYGGVAFRYLH
jgi:iron complex outermembrane recepter protein